MDGDEEVLFRKINAAVALPEVEAVGLSSFRAIFFIFSIH